VAVPGPKGARRDRHSAKAQIELDRAFVTRPKAFAAVSATPLRRLEPLGSIEVPGTGLRERRTHHLHVVLFHEPLVRVRIYTLSLREHLLEATGRHTEK
jgi:hypothetical protein